jgi:hypothetical protein
MFLRSSDCENTLIEVIGIRISLRQNATSAALNFTWTICEQGSSDAANGPLFVMAGDVRV